VTPDGRVLLADSALDVPPPTYPYVALLVIQQISEIVAGRSRVTPEHFGAQMLELSKFFHVIANHRVLDERKLVNLLSVTYFIHATLEASPPEFCAAKAIMASAIRLLTVPIASAFTARFLGVAFRPKSLQRELSQLGRWFTVYGIPDVIWTEMRNWFLLSLDSEIALKWIASDFKPDLAVGSYLEITPDFKWPKFAGLLGFVADIQLIAAKKRKAGVYSKDLPLQWMKDVFARKKIDPKVVDWFLKGAKGRVQAAECVDIDDWIEEKLIPLCRMKLPPNLPTVE
jgi:hypothetical protein